MKKYPGITKETDRHNNTKIMVMFKHEGTRYPKKNFTKLFGCTTLKQAYDKLQEVKISITKGQNPFITSEVSLNEIFEKRVSNKRISGEWSENTIANYELFYDKEIKQKLGHKKLNKITYSDLLKILEDSEFIKKKSVWKNRLKQILNPIFKDALKQGTIFTNPCDNIDNYSSDEPEELHSKLVSNDILPVTQELYKAIPKYPVKTKEQKPEYECFLYLVVLTARRIGELCQLQKKNCYLNHSKIISPKEITKTKKEFEFPVPDECIKYIESVGDGLLFPNIKRDSVYLMFQRLLKYTSIDTRNNKTLTVHNTRDLMLNIMIENGIDSRLADFCLDHKPIGVIRSYLSFSYKQKKDAFEKFWGLVRDDQMFMEKEKFKEEFFKRYEKEFEKEWELRKDELIKSKST